MLLQKVTLIKLGGSVATFKERPLSSNIDAIEGISHTLTQLNIPLIIVHGGGSFGHYWSVKYNMHTKPANYDVHGVSLVHESMIALNQIIVNSMMRAGLNPYGIPPSALTIGHKPIVAKIKQIYAMAKSKLIPVTFGDIVYVEDAKFSILSGDSLMTILARVLRPLKVIFATNVDGVYKDNISREIVNEIQVINERNSIEFFKTSGIDATGGMQRKVTEAFKIASNGIDVVMINGLVPERIIEAAEGTLKVGTVVKGRKS
ncbi:MAG TPA: isopentenyl phosphate kinase [Nitrososphaera sp.]|nr:isopentenyl phosphate kinase [Nitrososphaera sp.]